MTTKPHVLVVDDDEQLCVLVRATLELEGIEVRDARDAIEAEKMILQRVPNAVLLDIGLPGIDGLFCGRAHILRRTADRLLRSSLERVITDATGAVEGRLE